MKHLKTISLMNTNKHSKVTRYKINDDIYGKHTNLIKIACRNKFNLHHSHFEIMTIDAK